MGQVRFDRGSEGLTFEAKLSRTRDGDEQLELIADGCLRSVSLGFRPVHHVQRSMPEGVVTVRTEVAIRELSLAPTGWGQVPSARILAMRSEHGDDVHRPVWDALQRRRARLDLP